MFIFMTSTDHRKPTLNFKYLYEKYKNTVWVHICKRIYDRGLREDILQEVFLKLHQHLQTKNFTSEAKARAWLIRVAKNTTTDYGRKGNTINKHNVFRANDDIIFTNCTDTKSEQPLDEVLKQELAEDLQGALETLKPMHRQVVEMYFYDELSTEEIAEKLGIPQFTVYSRLRKARLLLDKEIDNLLKGGVHNV